MNVRFPHSPNDSKRYSPTPRKRFATSRQDEPVPSKRFARRGDYGSERIMYERFSDEQRSKSHILSLRTDRPAKRYLERDLE